ncbi:hypothetical protein PNEG_01962 [Pneumocystis murina B123]|uniref:Structural maintenance of chromosomes protein n=1 Tax=Pneumocystis murina (strain B123) TaxID=1069680 RepID=M7NM98_PNEMU|nr:hypothetical protein PNEG_01962 [Pneumocystis murina B123]EMR09778.1 hypothetical protein PNEG_01962 [Pneumocystis murina B123]
MYLSEIIIDGFKSYAHRTVISGLDTCFNAITGPNGSGKSNILDAICFVLGITNMSTVRAQNLQDLIYKRGQAGITKASVTVIFDNSDSKKSPIGFEDHPQITVTRQIIMGGMSKYLINGHRAQQQTVQNLFHSVQLNINNPNFLIMQGRITKVLNMKSMEILSMIEEAAGTRMFEERKDKAIRTITKKDRKVEEINALLAEEIEPKLEKLRQEKKAFLEYQQIQSDVERFTKLVVAYDYLKSNDKLTEFEIDLQNKNNRVIDLESSIKTRKYEVTSIEENIKTLKEEKEIQLRKGGNFQKLENDFKDCSHELVRLNTLIELKEGSLAEEKIKLAKLEETSKELHISLEEKKRHFHSIEEFYNKLKIEFDAKNDEMNRKEELLQTLSTGIAAREGQTNNYTDQLQEARNNLNRAMTEEKQIILKMDHFQKRIIEIGPKANKAQKENEVLLNGLEKMKQELKVIEEKISALGLQNNINDNFYKEKSDYETKIASLTSRYENLKRNVANIDFTYSSPSPEFDHLKVLGFVAQLFTLDEKNYNASMALEVCAGGRLYNVVVEDEIVAAQLLQHGRLKKRVTIIPLSKISSVKIPVEKIDMAQKRAPGKVNLALDLINYGKNVKAAMEYVFGSTVICENAEIAKQITFDPNLSLKSITLNGDIYDPSGTLSGGSSTSSNGVLVQLQKLNEVKNELNLYNNKLLEINTFLEKNKERLDKISSLKKNYDLKSHEIKLTEKQISLNSSSKVMNEIKELESNIELCKTTLAEVKLKQEQYKKDIKEIEKDMEEFKNNKDSKLLQLQKTLEKLKSVVEKQSENVKLECKKYQSLKLEKEQLEGDLVIIQKQLKENNALISSQNSEINTLKFEQAQAKENYEKLQRVLENERAKLTGYDKEFKHLENAMKIKTSYISEANLELQSLRHEINRLNKDKQSTLQSLNQMEAQYEWISDEKENFGKPSTAFDFSDYDIKKCKASLNSLTERFQALKKKINPKVINMIDGVEKKENALKTMVKTIHKDKRKIEDTIKSLEDYKMEALQRTWKKVNSDFGKIFSDLLPGSFAKLVPLDKKTIADGLEIKVCLGKVWKDSLAELSGGQRSLVALSLIMSLLQFKPAPMYILDEVDAALDLSHTQNIGHLIKTKFKGAQFIVVSLKDGMFSNANRIFTTKFVHGHGSVVETM